MLDGLMIGRFVVCTEERRLPEPSPGAGAWVSTAFLYEGEGALDPYAVLSPSPGDDALEARRHAIIDARRYVKAIEQNDRRRAARARPLTET